MNTNPLYKFDRDEPGIVHLTRNGVIHHAKLTVWAEGGKDVEYGSYNVAQWVKTPQGDRLIAHSSYLAVRQEAAVQARRVRHFLGLRENET